MGNAFERLRYEAEKKFYSEAATYDYYVNLWHTGEYRNIRWEFWQILVRRFGALVAPNQWITEALGIPTALKGKPIKQWGGTVSGGACPHTLVDQMRFVSGVALLEQGEVYELPLSDANGVPYLDPAVPPMIMVRADTMSQSGDDPVTNPRSSANSDATRWLWRDTYTAMPLLGDDTTHLACEWSLRLVRQPYPHWVVRMAYNTNVSSPDPFMGVHVAAVGQGAGPHFVADHATNTEQYEVTEGSSWEHGHSTRSLVLQQIGTPVHSRDVVNGTQAEMNRASLMYGVLDIAGGGTQRTIQLARPTGLTTDTSIFTSFYPPFIQVFSDGDRTTRTNTQTTWKASTLGAAPAAIEVANRNTVHFGRYAFASELSYNHANSMWQVLIENGTSPSVTRSFYFWTFSGD